MTILSRAACKYLWLILLMGFTGQAWAHPMGNFSVNHYSGVTLENDGIRIRYYIDLAEIPTYQELQQANIKATDVDPHSAVVKRYIAARGEELGKGLTLEVDGQPVTLRLVSSGVIFPPGAGGLSTMKMGFVYDASYPSTQREQQVSIHYVDNNFPGHAGWKEIVAVSSGGTLLRSSVPAIDRSEELSNYQTDLLNSPPQDLEASLMAILAPAASALSEKRATPIPARAPARSIEASTARNQTQRRIATTPTPLPRESREAPQPATEITPAVQLHANVQQTPRSRFTELIQAEHLDVWFLFTAALIAICLGGLHALEPGHGKTIVAAYLVGSRGTARHAFLLGLIVTASHTGGVIALGAITLYASRYIVPEKLYPWLGALSGIVIAGLGCYMLLRRLSGTAADHSHAHGASHVHWQFWKRENAAGTEIERDNYSVAHAQPSLTQLFTLGITGGIIPCPAALIVLLSAVALHRIGLGMFLIVAFSAGLAAVLIAFGMLIVFARHFMSRLKIDGPLTRRWLPVMSSAFITVLGLMLAVQSLSTMHFDANLFSKEKLGTVLFVTGLGLILGMRHSTDADHVVAISTIVSRQRSIRTAAFIGSVWGIGHTITIFIVGSLIILWGVEIPPRIGLSMEFSVAIMLVLLGLLNLSGILHKVTSRLTPRMADSIGARFSPNRDVNAGTITKWLESRMNRLGLYQFFRPLVIGLVHGLAGSAAVALLVLSTIRNPVWATIYLLIFGAGTMIGMMCMTTAIAVPLRFGGNRFARLDQYLGMASGMVSLCFGSVLVYQLGFLGGLFTNHPQWVPK